MENGVNFMGMEASWLREALRESEKKLELQDAKWYQIHTNGASITFARFYMNPDGTGEFEKMEADHVNGTCDIFAEEHYYEWQDARTRLRVAIEEMA